MSGKTVFQLMDTHGLPFETINDELSAKDMAFNVLEFCEAAAASGNHKPHSISRLLCEHAPTDEAKDLSRLCVLKAYGSKEVNL